MLSRLNAIELDKVLIRYFTIEQLIEVAGQACAIAIAKEFEPQQVCVLVGHGNNGNDALVCSRYLRLFGFQVTVIAPKIKNQIFNTIDGFDIDLHKNTQDLSLIDDSTLIVDGLLGFSASGPPRDPYTDYIQFLASTSKKVVAIDIPSGWDVDKGDTYNTNYNPSMLISLSAPKLFSRHFQGIHYVGGRFINKSIANQFNINVDYPAYELVKKIQ